MPERLSSNATDLQDFLTQRQAARELAIISGAFAEQIHFKVAERGVSFESLLGEETIMLTNRMRQLYKHPKWPRFLGGSVVKMSGEVRQPAEYSMGYGSFAPQYDTIVSPFLLSSESEAIWDTLLKDCYVFNTGVERSRRSHAVLGISHWAVDQESGSARKIKEDSYGITVYGSFGRVGSVVVTGPDFSSYDSGILSRSMAAYVRQGRKGYNEVQAKAGKYPDEFYHLPLGLVRGARRELASPNWLAKVLQWQQ
jgi:hypothetical protein